MHNNVSLYFNRITTGTSIIVLLKRNKNSYVDILIENESIVVATLSNNRMITEYEYNLIKHYAKDCGLFFDEDYKILKIPNNAIPYDVHQTI